MPNFKPVEDLSIAPVWVLLPKLPFHMHTWQYIKQIVSSVGTPLEIDQATRSRTRPNMAKVRVEIDLLKPQLESVYVGLIHENSPETSFMQKLEYEGIPKYCKNCRKLGHAIVNGRVLERKRAIKQQKLEEQNREKDNAEHTNAERQNEQGRTPEMDNVDNDDENNLEKLEGKKDASNKVEREKKENLTTISERINKDKKKEKKWKLPKKKSKVFTKPNIVQQIGKRTKKNQLKATSKVKALEEAIKTPINSNDNREAI
ncbi:hypothetical protein BC332_16379 [Capsicum chinense]|nr:hypothetical protein BC332_16379 [Capsicum chinense]